MNSPCKVLAKKLLLSSDIFFNAGVDFYFKFT